jgi:hypothetical protein
LYTGTITVTAGAAGLVLSVAAFSAFLPTGAWPGCAIPRRRYLSLREHYNWPR